MKMWHESARILDRLQSIHDGGGKAAIAVLVRIEGSSYRRPGAKLLVTDDGSSLGSISGGCLEEDVRQIALEVMAESVPRQLRYRTGSDDETVWGLGLGCDGVVDLFVHPATPASYMETVATQRQLLAGSEALAVATVIEAALAHCAPGRSIVIASGEIAAGGTGDADLDASIRDLAVSPNGPAHTGLYSLDMATVFLDLYRPPPSLIVVGAGDDAIPLVRLAADVGFRVFVVDHRAGYLTSERFPDAFRFIHARDSGSATGLPSGDHTFGVVKTHSLNRDRDWVRAMASVPLPYVGLLGPSDRREEILAEMAENESARVYGPVGLDLGAEGPDQVALSIVAELLAVATGRSAGHLRDAGGAIHVGP